MGVTATLLDQIRAYIRVHKQIMSISGALAVQTSALGVASTMARWLRGSAADKNHSRCYLSSPPHGIPSTFHFYVWWKHRLSSQIALIYAVHISTHCYGLTVTFRCMTPKISLEPQPGELSVRLLLPDFASRTASDKRRNGNPESRTTEPSRRRLGQDR